VEAHRWRGDLREARTSAIEAFGLLRAQRTSWFEVVGLLGITSAALGDVGWVLSLAERLMEVGPAGLAQATQDAYLVAAGRIASHLFYSGKHAIGSQILAKVDSELASCRPEPPAVAALASARGVRGVSTGDYSTALEQLRVARTSYEHAGDVRAQAMVTGNIAYIHMLVGHYADAANLLTMVGEISRRLGLQHAVAGVKHNLGLALLRVGKLDEALATERAALALLLAQGNHRVGAGARAYLASILLAMGSLEDAEREAEEAVAMANPSPSVRALTLATLSDVKLARGDAAAALTSAEQALTQLEKMPSDEHETYVRLVLARAARAAGDLTRARAVAHESAERLAERAARIGDAALCRSFLEDVPENAATRALARELTSDATGALPAS
jgi:tetratricopeptide (TPR) repeat protein